MTRDARRRSCRVVPSLVVLLLLLMSVIADRADAQGPAATAGRPPGATPTVEARADLLAARNTTLHLGVAALWPVSPYLRVGGVAGAGVTRGPAASGAEAASARAGIIARFTLDPDPTARWRLYGQATAGVLAVRGNSGRALVSVSLGAEHRAIGPLRPAIELGVGGGLRVAIALRRGR